MKVDFAHKFVGGYHNVCCDSVHKSARNGLPISCSCGKIFANEIDLCQMTVFVCEVNYRRGVVHYAFLLTASGAIVGSYNTLKQTLK